MQITLDVGGTLFATTQTTLEKHGFFRALLDSDNSDKSYFFIDRDPLFFRWILNFIRGSTVIPRDISDYDQLKVEADFYCMDIPAFNKYQGVEYELQKLISRV